jgi:hypothetical protein
MKTKFLAALAFLAPAALALSAPRMGAQGVNLWRLEQVRAVAAKPERLEASPTFVAQTFTQPLDHNVKNSPTWQQRFWVSTQHYDSSHAGPVPVFVFDGGEGSGELRFPLLDTGVIGQLTQATGGIGVVLEHRCVCCISLAVLELTSLRRYYGESIPVQNFTTDSMRCVDLLS